MKRLAACMSVVVAILSLQVASAAQASEASDAARERFRTQHNAAVEWMRRDGHHLNTVEPDANEDDLVAFEPILRGVQILGVGEATHGTSEFFKFKSRLFRFLVRNMNFRVLAIEADWSECIAIDDYVTSGNGSAEKGLCNLGYPHWKREEILDLINWMRAYNSTLPKTNYESCCVHFCGLENTQPEYSENWLENFLKKNCSNKSAAIVDLKKLVASLSTRKDPAKFEGELVLALSKVNAAVKSCSNKVAPDKMLEAQRQFSHYCDGILSNNTPNPLASNYRDKSMTKNVEEMRTRFGVSAKIMIWAHNGHVSHPPDAKSWDWVPVGVSLHQRYGNRYYALAQFFLQGSFSALDFENRNPNGQSDINQWSRFWVDVPEVKGLDTTCEEADIGNFFVDFRPVSSLSLVGKWLERSHNARECATGFADLEKLKWSEPVRLDWYDGLVFIEKTTAAKSLRCTSSK